MAKKANEKSDARGYSFSCSSGGGREFEVAQARNACILKQDLELFYKHVKGSYVRCPGHEEPLGLQIAVCDGNMFWTNGIECMYLKPKSLESHSGRNIIPLCVIDALLKKDFERVFLPLCGSFIITDRRDKYEWMFLSIVIHDSKGGVRTVADDPGLFYLNGVHHLLNHRLGLTAAPLSQKDFLKVMKTIKGFTGTPYWLDNIHVKGCESGIRLSSVYVVDCFELMFGKAKASNMSNDKMKAVYSISKSQLRGCPRGSIVYESPWPFDAEFVVSYKRLENAIKNNVSDTLGIRVNDDIIFIEDPATTLGTMIATIVKPQVYDVLEEDILSED